MTDWAWFGASSHAHAASLAGALADAGGPLPDLDVRADGVRVRGGDLPAITATARGLGLVEAPEVLQELRLRFETTAPVEQFWRTALDHPGGVDRWRRCPPIGFAPADAHRPLRNRLHVDAGQPGPVEDVVRALEAAGGREQNKTPWFSNVADADGNEVDVVPGGPLESAVDWTVLFGAMACYPGLAPRQAADLAATAARLADEAGVALLIDVRAEGVVLDSGKDQWETVAGFADLAAAVQAAARAAGLRPDNSLVRFVQVGIDAVDVPAVREFWRAVLGYLPVPDPGLTDLYDPRWLNPVVFIQPMDAEDTERRRQRDRVHLELAVPAEHLRARVDTALAAGGRVLTDGPDGTRLADPEGNELTLTPS